MLTACGGGSDSNDTSAASANDPLTAQASQSRLQILSAASIAASAPPGSQGSIFRELESTGYPNFRDRLRDEVLRKSHRPVAATPLYKVPNLKLGQGVVGLDGEYLKSYVAKVLVPYGTGSITFSISGGVGDADIFVARAGGRPTANQSCYSEGSTNTDSCTLNSPVPGWYTMVLYAAAPFQGLSVGMTVNQAPVSDVDAARFLTKSTFGPTVKEIDSVKTLGMDGWLDLQFSKPIVMTHGEWILKNGLHTNKIPINRTEESIFYKSISSDDQLRQRAANALAQIFVISTYKVEAPYAHAAYADLLERNAFGNFRDLLKDVTYSAAMGKFLDAGRSSAEKTVNGVTTYPDENYAREVMQLFTIGLHKLNIAGGVVKDSHGEPIPTYGNDDVAGLSRVFTGLRVTPGLTNPTSGNPMVVNESLHEQGAKTFLGQTVPAGLKGDESIRQALDILFNHPNVGPFIARQLIQRMVTSNPSAGHVQRVAQAFNNNGAGVRGDMKAVWRAVLTDYDSLARRSNANEQAKYGKVREPLLRVTAWARAAGIHSADTAVPITSGGAFDLLNLKQAPFRSPSVFNFYRPGYVPQDAFFAQHKLTAPEMQIADEVSNLAHIRLIGAWALKGRSTKLPDFSSWDSLQGDPVQLQQRAELLLAPGRFSAERRQLIVDAVATVPENSADWKKKRSAMALMLTAMSPEHIIQK